MSQALAGVEERLERVHKESVRSDRNTSALRFELSNIRKEMSQLRANFSLIQEELGRVKNGTTDKCSATKEDVEKKDGLVEKADVDPVRRLKHTVRLLKEGVKVYDDFIDGLDGAIAKHIKDVDCGHFYCSGGDISGAIEEMRSTTLRNATQLQKRIRDMMLVIDRTL